jgi:hypothetical protein
MAATSPPGRNTVVRKATLAAITGFGGDEEFRRPYDDGLKLPVL